MHREMGKGRTQGRSQEWSKEKDQGWVSGNGTDWMRGRGRWGVQGRGAAGALGLGCNGPSGRLARVALRGGSFVACSWTAAAAAAGAQVLRLSCTGRGHV